MGTSGGGRTAPRIQSRWFRGDWADRVRALAEGRLTPVEPRRAATVMLLRDAAAPSPDDSGHPVTPDPAGGDGVAVFLLRRRASLGFAARMHAYPGGGVDPRDETPVAWAGPGRAEWAARLGLAGTAPDDVAEAQAQAVVCAAVRETFEESGVLLAGPDADSVVADTTGPDWEADRAALVARELSFAAFLARRRLVLRSDLLGLWARWITPEFEERRYDTWFFTAALPAGQRARNLSTEADRTGWLTPRQALRSVDRGEVAMLPPTLATLRELAAHDSVAAVLAAAGRRAVSPVQARVRRQGGTLVISWPGYEEFEERIPVA